MTQVGERLLERDVSALLALAGRAVHPPAIEDCPGGGNNRVYRVVAGADEYIVKWYFSHPSDTRDRLHSEYSFLRYARSVGCRQVPAPLASLPEHHLALYEFIPGRKLAAEEIDREHIDQAIRFIAALNGPQRRVAGLELPDASEARFSVAGHLDAIRGRVERLSAVEGNAPEDDEARAVIAEIGALLGRHSAAVERDAPRHGIETSVDLAPESRCISPSDFGFHNVLVRPSGELCFLDFEYAGQDDPAKLINDFFWQPAVTVPGRFYDAFLEGCVRYSAEADRLAARTRLLRPLFGIKWCCILLNEFLPASARRRRFARPEADAPARKRAQLAKVRHLIDSLSH
ncbi:MAG: aminoglycoside phosphotransferase family protein [Burkholderiales bacterium]